jgi:hypothetical protein
VSPLSDARKKAGHVGLTVEQELPTRSGGRCRGEPGSDWRPKMPPQAETSAAALRPANCSNIMGPGLTRSMSGCRLSGVKSFESGSPSQPATSSGPWVEAELGLQLDPHLSLREQPGQLVSEERADDEVEALAGGSQNRALGVAPGKPPSLGYTTWVGRLPSAGTSIAAEFIPSRRANTRVGVAISRDTSPSSVAACR